MSVEEDDTIIPISGIISTNTYRISRIQQIMRMSEYDILKFDTADIFSQLKRSSYQIIFLLKKKFYYTRANDMLMNTFFFLILITK